MTAENVTLTSKPKKDWFTLIFMLLAHGLAFMAPFYFTWSGFGIFLLMYFATGCLGITFCFHRLLSHRSFQAHPLVTGFTALMGTLALQGTVQEWVADHRMHHRASDTPRDPHNARLGFWYSHMGWILLHHRKIEDRDTLQRYTKDIMANRWLAFLSRHEVMIAAQILFGVMLGLLGGVSWILWGVFFRLFAVYHTTWFVNSATHKWGYRNFPSKDLAVNNWWVALLTWGEGWHNNHHRYAQVCTVRFRWWEVDFTYGIIYLLSKLKLTWGLKMFPTEAEQEFAHFRSERKNHNKRKNIMPEFEFIELETSPAKAKATS